MSNLKFQKQTHKCFRFFIILSWLVVCPSLAFAAKTVPGVVPNSPPLFQSDPNVKPNLSGSIQNAGSAVLPGEASDGSGGVAEQERTPKSATISTTALPLLTRHVGGLWWLLVLALGFGGYVWYRRWRRV